MTKNSKCTQCGSEKSPAYYLYEDKTLCLDCHFKSLSKKDGGA